MQSTNEQSLTGDLDWLAFCYVADELSDDERATFEARLADDQGACEALARAVELTQAVALAEAHEPARTLGHVSRRTAWPLRLAWMSVGAAAALVLVAVALNWQANPVVDDFPGVDRGELAEVWSRTRDEVRQIVQIEPLELPPEMETEFSTDEALPSWITAAVFNEPVERELDGPSTHDES